VVGKGVKSMALFPAKFQKSFWIKNGEWFIESWLILSNRTGFMTTMSLRVCSKSVGSFIFVNAIGRDQALESGSKIVYVVSQVLFHEQVQALEKSRDW
jgi:probable RNA-binding protein EIF1AD